MTKPILKDFPEQFETERLIIRGPRVGDGKAMNEAILNSLKELAVWMPWARQAPSVEDSEENIRRAVSRFQTREDLRLMLFLKDGTLAGGSGLHRIDWDVPKFEVGYWLRTSLCGRGYMTEAVAGITRFAFEQLGAQRVEIHADDRNVRSWRVAERLKFPLEGILRNHARDVDGGLRDTRIYAKTQAD
jgi:RimJ/RimL family protein N-acetyltransferase